MVIPVPVAPARASYGKPVVDGEIRYLSPSSIGTGDPSQTGGCPRRYWYKYVAGKREPTTAAMTAGVAIHAQIEHYLKTGEKALGAQALAGSRFVPAPDSEGDGAILVEHAIAPGELTAAGIPVIGYIDLVKIGRVYADEEGDRGIDPDGTVELLDWKTTGDVKRGKAGHDLIRTIQMPAYAEWASRKYGAAHLRLSHVYFSTKGRPASRKSTSIHSRENIARRWEEIERVARSLVQIARVKPGGEYQVEANTAACHAWGGCPHRGYCKVGSEASLEQMFGKGGAQSLLSKIDSNQGDNMSLLAKVKGAEVKLDLKAEMAKLAAEQAAAKPVPALPPGFEAACKAVESAGKGFPTLLGKAAEARCLMIGHTLSGAGLAGSGVLSGLSLSDPAQMSQLADELGVSPAAPAPPLAGILPDDAPESKPELAAKPVEGWTPPGSPEAAPAAAQVSPEAVKRGRGRPRKADAPPVSQRQDVSEPVQVDAVLVLYIDAIPSCSFERLEPYVESLCATLASEFGAADIRCAPKDGPLAFGQWKGALAALAREKPPTAGTYVLLSRTETSEVVADALSAIAETFVRGVR